jgi:hypothetical protein
MEVKIKDYLISVEYVEDGLSLIIYNKNETEVILEQDYTINFTDNEVLSIGRSYVEAIEHYENN